MFQVFTRLLVLQAFLGFANLITSSIGLCSTEEKIDGHTATALLHPSHFQSRSTSAPNAPDALPVLPPPPYPNRTSSATHPTISPTQILYLPGYSPTPSPASSSTISPYPTSYCAHLLFPDIKTASPFGLMSVKEDASSNNTKVSLTTLQRLDSDPTGMSEGLKSCFRSFQVEDTLDKIKDDLIKKGLLQKSSSNGDLFDVINHLANPPTTLAQNLTQALNIIQAVPSYDLNNPDQKMLEQILYNLMILAERKYKDIQRPTEKYPFGKCHV